MSAAWAAVAATLTIAFFTLAAWALRWAWRILARTTRFLDDFFGEAPHDGLAAQPGVMARLGTLEQLTAKVAAETTPNGGKSLRDVIGRIERDVSLIKTDQGEMRRRMELFEANRAGREGSLCRLPPSPALPASSW